MQDLAVDLPRKVQWTSAAAQEVLSYQGRGALLVEVRR